MDIQFGIETLPNVFAVGDEQGDEIVLGRDVLNRFAIVLDGPAKLTTLR